MLIKTRKVKWNAPTASDVVSHIVYAVKGTDTLFRYDLPHYIEVPMPALECVLPGTMAALFDAETDYTLYVVAKDATGNLSDAAAITSFFDLTAPTAPSGLEVE